MTCAFLWERRPRRDEQTETMKMDSAPMFSPVERKEDPSHQEALRIARNVLQIEAEGLLYLAEHLDERFAEAVDWIYGTPGRVIVSGVGKSGIVGRKIVATLSSTGTPSLFLHPVEAMHGDLGMVRREDIVLALSNSGETDEVNFILPSIRGIGARIIAFTGNLDSTLARTSDIAIYTGVPREACPLGLAPTASSTAMLAMGDALAVALIKKRDFQPKDFRRFHPGGQLGKRLQVNVREVMRTGPEVPAVHRKTPLPEAVEEIHRKRMGATLVLGGDGILEGIFTDGDLRRAFQNLPDLRGRTVEEVMSRDPRSMDPDGSVAEALEVMERHLITVLPVVDGGGRVLGILHLHDLLGKGQIRFTA
jgi:arabinose-5-phosphate isomerase